VTPRSGAQVSADSGRGRHVPSSGFRLPPRPGCAIRRVGSRALPVHVHEHAPRLTTRPATRIVSTRPDGQPRRSCRPEHRQVVSAQQGGDSPAQMGRELNTYSDALCLALHAISAVRHSCRSAAGAVGTVPKDRYERQAGGTRAGGRQIARAHSAARRWHARRRRLLPALVVLDSLAEHLVCLRAVRPPGI